MYIGKKQKSKTLIAVYTWLTLVCLTHGLKFIANCYYYFFVNIFFIAFT